MLVTAKSHPEDLTHLPVQQRSPPEQALAQLPQLFRSDEVSTHLPPHDCCDPEHDVVPSEPPSVPPSPNPLPPEPHAAMRIAAEKPTKDRSAVRRSIPSLYQLQLPHAGPHSVVQAVPQMQLQ